MPRKGGNPFLSGYEEIFSGVRDGPDVQHERVQQIPLSELHPFEGHPFRVVDDEEMQKTVESVKQYGVLTPAIARPDPDGGYEIISGHRRMRACELAGIETLPVIVRDMDDDTAIIFMVDANLQREHILPSERAFAYRMKLEAMKHQAGRPSKENYSQVGNNSGKTSSQEMAEELGISKNQIFRFIRLTELIPEIRDMVDEKRIAFNPAVELSYLKPEEQKEFLEAMDYAQTSPSLSQAQRIKRMSQEGQCTLEQMCDVMNELKKDDMTTVTISHDVLRKYFPRSYTPQQMQDVIVKLLDQWQKKRNRDQSR